MRSIKLCLTKAAEPGGSDAGAGAAVVPVLVRLYRRVFCLDGTSTATTLPTEVITFAQTAVTEILTTVTGVDGAAAAMAAASAAPDAVDKTSMDITLENALSALIDLVASGSAAGFRGLSARLAVVKTVEAVHGTNSTFFTSTIEKLLLSRDAFTHPSITVTQVQECLAYLNHTSSDISPASAALATTFTTNAKQVFPYANVLGSSVGAISMLSDDPGVGVVGIDDADARSALSA
mgnify:CR=1 FL=1